MRFAMGFFLMLLLAPEFAQASAEAHGGSGTTTPASSHPTTQSPRTSRPEAEENDGADLAFEASIKEGEDLMEAYDFLETAVLERYRIPGEQVTGDSASFFFDENAKVEEKK